MNKKAIAGIVIVIIMAIAGVGAFFALRGGQ